MWLTRSQYAPEPLFCQRLSERLLILAQGESCVNAALHFMSLSFALCSTGETSHVTSLEHLTKNIGNQTLSSTASETSAIISFEIHFFPLEGITLNFPVFSNLVIFFLKACLETGRFSPRVDIHAVK